MQARRLITNMADSPLISLFKRMASQQAPVAYDRQYRYPIYDVGDYGNYPGLDAFYIPKNFNKANAESNGPTVVINSKNSPRSLPATSNIDVMDWITRNKDSGPASLAHERVHHIQANEGMNDPIIPQGEMKSGYDKVVQHMYNPKNVEAQAYLLSNTLSPKIDESMREDGATQFRFTHPFFSKEGMIDWKGKGDILSQDWQNRIQKILFDQLPENAKRSIQSRQVLK